MGARGLEGFEAASAGKNTNPGRLPLVSPPEPRVVAGDAERETQANPCSKPDRSLAAEARRLYDYMKGLGPDPDYLAVHMVETYLTNVVEASRSLAWHVPTNILDEAASDYKQMRFNIFANIVLHAVVLPSCHPEPTTGLKDVLARIH